MTQEYEFFKDFAGVTKADLEMFKCGGKSKKKMQKGGKTEEKNDTVVHRDVGLRWGGAAGSDTTYTVVVHSPKGSREIEKGSRTVEKIPVINKTIRDSQSPNYKRLGNEYNKQQNKKKKK